MTMPEDLTTAILCARVADRISNRRDGIIDLSSGRVHLREELFHKVFNTWIVEPHTDGRLEYHIHKVDGVAVFCLAEKEDGHVQDNA